MTVCEYFTFDLYGTLVDIRTFEPDHKSPCWDLLSKLLRRWDVHYSPKELCEQYYSLCRDELARAVRRFAAPAELDVGNVWRRILNGGQGEVPDDQRVYLLADVFRAYVTIKCRPFHHADVLLRHLKESGKKIVLLTNAQEIYTRAEIRMCGIADYFDKIIISSETGIKKPREEFFRLALDFFGAESGQVMHIGNSPECDIIPARQLGMKTCYVLSEQTERDAPVVWKDFQPDLYLDTPDMDRLIELLLAPSGHSNREGG